MPKLVKIIRVRKEAIKSSFLPYPDIPPIIELDPFLATLRKIEKILKIPRSTLSGWIKDVQLSEKQKEKFGETYQYLSIRNFDTWDALGELGITSTPTWVINNNKYEGVQSIRQGAKIKPVKMNLDSLMQTALTIN